MLPYQSHRRAHCPTLLMALVVIVLLHTGSVGFAQQINDSLPVVHLAQSARDQLAAVLQEKATRTPAQLKIDSHFVMALRKSRGEAMMRALPNLHTGVPFRADGLVEVDITAKVSNSLLSEIRWLGGTVVSSVPRFDAIRALLSLTQLEKLAADPRVRWIGPAVYPTGNTDSQGDTTMQVKEARSSLGLTGKGVTVGVLSGDVNYLSQLQANNLLPAVSVLSGQAGTSTEGEGTAMLEVVHDLAPGAALCFAQGGPSPAQMAQNILNLQSQLHCNIICDDISFFNDPPFQDGIIAQAVNTVVNNGGLYVSCAINDGNFTSGTSSVWQGDYAYSGQTITVTVNGTNYTEDIHTYGGGYVGNAATGANGGDLWWSDPLGKSSNDYDLFVFDSTGSNLLGASTNVQNGTQDPYEELIGDTFPDGSLYVIGAKSSAAPRFLRIDCGGQNCTFNTAWSNEGTRGHNAAASALTIGAVGVAQAYPNAFSASSTLETFSCDGPRRMFFNPDGSAITPGNFLAATNGGKQLLKPDFAAADGVSTDLPAGGLNPFFGTSCATPHAAAIAALFLGYEPTLTRSALSQIWDTTAWKIMNTAGTDWNDNAGYGLINALNGSLLLVANSLKPAITLTPSTVSAGASSTGTVSASIPAPPAGLPLSLSSDNALVKVPGTLTIAAGQTSATFAITTSASTTGATAHITATSFPSTNVHTTATGTLSLTATNAAAISSVSLNATNVVGGAANPTGTVTFSAAVPSSGTVTLTSSDTTSATVANVNVASGATSVTFPVTTAIVSTNKTVTLTANYNNSSKTATLTVTPLLFATQGLVLNPTSVLGGKQNSTGTITLNAAPLKSATVTLTSNDTTSAKVPATATLAANSKTATFTVTSLAVTAVKTPSITATFNGSSQSAKLTVNPTATLTLAANPTSIPGGHHGIGTVTLGVAAPSGGTVVTLSTSNTAVYPAVKSVTVLSGQTTAHFLIDAAIVASDTKATLTAKTGVLTSTATVTAVAVRLASLSFNPSTIEGGLSSTLTISLTGAAPTAGVTVTLKSSNTALLTVPGTVTIPAGTTSVTLLLDTPLVTTATSVTVTGVASAVTTSGTLQITP